jgi:hypothetical protein
MHAALATAVAAVVTFFELDRTFYVPPNAERRRTLWALWWAFVIGNGLLAGGLYLVVVSSGSMDSLDPWLRAGAVGVGYLGLIRLKFGTFGFEGKDVPFGFEFFYESAKAAVYKRINRIAQRARTKEAIGYATAHSLGELATEAKLQVQQDQLLAVEQKEKLKAWILRLVEQPGSSDLDERAALADFILSGLPPSDVSS